MSIISPDTLKERYLAVLQDGLKNNLCRDNLPLRH
jgi:hypothetical protein